MSANNLVILLGHSVLHHEAPPLNIVCNIAQLRGSGRNHRTAYSKLSGDHHSNP